MTIAELAGPVLLRVLPTTIGVLLVTCFVATLPVLLPRFATWLKGGDFADAPPHGHHVPSTHHHNPHQPGQHGAAHHAPHVEHEHTYSI